MFKESLFEEVTFEQRPDRSERANQVDNYEKTVHGQGSRHSKALRWSYVVHI